MRDTTDAALAVATASLIATVYGSCLPPAVTVRQAPDYDRAQQRAFQAATAQAVVLVAVIGALTRSRPAVIVGAVMIGAQAMTYGPAVLAMRELTEDD